MSTKTRPRLKVVRTDDPAPASPCCIAGCPAAEAAELALIDYEIGSRTYSSGLYVDWEYVAYKMAQTIRGEDDERERPS